MQTEYNILPNIFRGEVKCDFCNILQQNNLLDRICSSRPLCQCEIEEPRGRGVVEVGAKSEGGGG